MKLLIALSLLVSQTALADAYYSCKAPLLGGVDVYPQSVSKKGNTFTLTLSPNMPIVAALGLPTTESYALNGAFDACEAVNPNAAHASYCYSGTQGSDVTAVGEADGSVTHFHFRGMSVKATDEVLQTPWATLARVNVQIILDYLTDKSVTSNMSFEVPLPGAAPNSPSQCN